MPSIPRLHGKTCFLATGTGYRSEKTAIYTPHRLQNSLSSSRNGAQEWKTASKMASGLILRSAIRIPLRFMLISRCRAMHPVRNTAFGEQAPHGCIPSCLRTACSKR